MLFDCILLIGFSTEIQKEELEAKNGSKSHLSLWIILNYHANTSNPDNFRYVSFSYHFAPIFCLLVVQLMPIHIIIAAIQLILMLTSWCVRV